MIQTSKLTKDKVMLAKANGLIDKIYGEEVNRLIRLKYSQHEENAIYRHRLNGTGDEEFEKFNAYCEECKAKAREIIDNLTSG